MKCMMAGASGLVGGELLDLLLKDQEVTSVVSVGHRALSVKSERLQEIQTQDFKQLNLPQAEVAFCTLGTTIRTAKSKERFYEVDHDYVIHFAKSCKQAGVKTFVYVSAAGADSESNIFYNRVKGEVERDLAAINFEHLIIARPSLLLGERHEHRFFEGIAQGFANVVTPWMRGPLLGLRPIKGATVAISMLAAAKKTQKEKIKILSNKEMLNNSGS